MRIMLLRTAPEGLALRKVGPPPCAPPLGLLHIASALRAWSREPVEVSVRNLSTDARSLDDVVGLVAREKPDVVGLGALTIDEARLFACARAAKSAAPGAAVVAGGPHPTLNPERCLEEDAIDWVCIGEGERTVVELVEAMAAGSDPRSVPGLAWREGGGVARSAPRPFIEDMDGLPGPAWDLVDLDLYSRLYNFHDLPPLAPPYAPIVTGRGCPWKCIYCHNIFGRKPRLMSAGRVVDEIERLVREKGVGEIHVVDDVFNVRTGRVEAICDEIARRGLEIRIAFPNGLRGDAITPGEIRRLRDAGCYSITFAIETAVPRLQKMIGKNLDVRKVLENARAASDLGLVTSGYVMLGFPTETREEMETTIRLVERSAIHLPRLFTVCPFPGTGMYDLAVSHGFEPGDRDGTGYDYDEAAVNASTLPDDDLRDVLRNARRRIFTRPKRIAWMKRIVDLYGGMDSPLFDHGVWKALGVHLRQGNAQARSQRAALVIFNTRTRESRFWGNMQVSILGGDLSKLGLENEIFVALLVPGDEEHNRRVVEDLVEEVVRWGADAAVMHTVWLPWLPGALREKGVKRVLCLDPAQPCDLPEALRGMDPQAGVTAALLGAADSDEAGAVLARLDGPESFTPSFDYRFVGADGPVVQKLAFVSMQACPYTVSIEGNPAFAGLVLPDGVTQRGCSYCNGARHYRPLSPPDRRRILETQIRYLEKHLPGLEEIAVPFPEDHLEALSEIVKNARGSGPRPIVLSGQLRSTALVASEHSLARLLEACEGTGFAFHISVVGVESLDGRDLALYNRGTEEGVRASLEVLRRLRARFDPDGFMPTTVGSFILFHPWQDIEGIRHNIEAMREEGVVSLFQSLNFNDLRFHPGVPLYHLAARDGLLAEVERGKVQDVPLSGYFSELPWRFRDPIVARLQALWKGLEMRIPDRIGLLEACVEGVRADAAPDQGRAAEGVRRLAERLDALALPRDGQRRLLGVGSRSNTGPLRPPWQGARFPEDAASIARALDALGPLDGVRTTIWGPEPTILRSLSEIIAEVRRRKALEIEILTYGRMLVYPWYVSALGRGGTDVVTVLLHSHDRAVHDAAVRTPDAFDQATEGLKLLARMGPRPAVAAVAGPENRGKLARIADLAADLGARELRIIIQASGLDLADPEGLAADMEKAIRAARRRGLLAGIDRELCFRWTP